jgi:hypothetical protein
MAIPQLITNNTQLGLQMHKSVSTYTLQQVIIIMHSFWSIHRLLFNYIKKPWYF